METNALYYGDNLDILRTYVPSESVDLVYLDPPFNSNRDYNVIFKDESGRKSDAQIIAFEDTWHLDLPVHRGHEVAPENEFQPLGRARDRAANRGLRRSGDA